MSKTIMIMRHGKSDWQSSYENDFQRPLNKRGKKSSKLIGQFLSSINQLPEAIFCSSAVRAKTTVELAMDSGGWTCAAEYTMKLYEPNTEEVLVYIRAIDDCFSRVMLVGHEPWCSEVLQKLTGAAVKYPTATVAVIELNIDKWSQAFSNSGYLTLFMPSRPLLKA